VSFFENCDILTLTLLFSVVFLVAAFIVFRSLKNYELAIILVLLSPWAHWLFTPPVREGDIENMVPTIGSYVRISIVVLAGIIGVFWLLESRSKIKNKTSSYLLLLGCFVLYALLSTMYSIDKKYTFVRSSEFFFFFLFLTGFYYWLQSKTQLYRTLNIYFLIMTCGISINFLALVLFPGRSWSLIMPDRFQGFFCHPNTLGALCMLSYPVLMWKYHHLSSAGRVLILFLFCIVLFMHILSGSRSSLIISICGLFLWPLIKNRASLYSLAKVLSLALIVFSGFALLLQLTPASFKREVIDINDLTGRTELWHSCVQLVKEKPITGYGYGVGGKIWTDPRFYRAKQFLWSGSARASLHNGYLSVTIGLGFIGLLIWLILISIPTLRVMRLEPCGYKVLIVALIFQGMLLNFFETSIVSSSQNITSLVFWLFLVMAQRLTVLPSFNSTENLAVVSFVPKTEKKLC
jgi:O-antigen ligase